MFEDTLEMLRNYKLTQERVEEIRAEVMEQDDMKKLRKEISDLKAINAAFEGTLKRPVA